MKKWLRVSLISLGVIALVMVGTAFYVLSWPDFGGEFKGDRLVRMKKSPHYSGSEFFNTPENLPFDLMANLKDSFGGQVRTPPEKFPFKVPQVSESISPGLRAWWLGHATVMVEIDGRRGLTDAMLSEHAFPVHAVAPKRFNPSPVAIADLPKIDFVTVSHDHYDHLDMDTVVALAKNGTHFFVGLGIGAHLERWKVPAEQIHEMDWWDTKEFRGLKIHCTPARHYSGRKSMDDSTLWASWLVEGSQHKVFHSGDSGYAPHFMEIGKRLGPIDVAFIKIGDYGGGAGWKDIHMVTEDSVRAHQDLGAQVMFPIHWGTFDLSNHAWDEPIRRAVAAASANNVKLVTPMLGELYSHGSEVVYGNWWEKIGGQ